MVLPLILGGVASVLVKELPSIASWIAGDKTGKVIEQVTDIARDVLGTDDPNSIEAAIARDPDKALQFRMALIAAEAADRDARLAAEADQRRAELEEIKAAIADVQGARDQTTRLAEAGSSIAWGAPVTSVLITIVFATVLVLALTRTIPDSRLVDAMIAVLTAAQLQVVNYWLGSSRGSAVKDQALARVARG